jgi:hypothetical protein
VFCLVLEFREEKQIFAKVEGGDMDFFQEQTKERALHMRPS